MYIAVEPPDTKIVNPVLGQFSVVVCTLANSISACQGVLFSSDLYMPLWGQTIRESVNEVRSECFVRKEDIESKRMKENMQDREFIHDTRFFFLDKAVV